MGLFVLGFIFAVGLGILGCSKLYGAGYRLRKDATPMVVIHQHHAGGAPPATEEAKYPGGW